MPCPLPAGAGLMREPPSLLERTVQEWRGRGDLWVFGYASLIWRPEFDYLERREARVHGWHRALKMWSRVNRGTPEVPGLVFALLSGGSCHGAVLRVPKADGEAVLHQLWAREMVTGVYDPKWLHCDTTRKPVQALTFTLSRRSPNFTGNLGEHQYRDIFERSSGRYGTTLDYARKTLHCLQERGIHDPALARLLAHAGDPPSP